MDTNVSLAIAGLAWGVASSLYAIYVTRKSRREKSLVYEVMRPVDIAKVIRGQSAYSLKVVYEKPNQAPIYVEHAVEQYVRFTNLGRAPIMRNDMVQGDPLRIEISGGNVLDMSIVGVTRDVCRIAIGPIKSDGKTTTASVEFDFLDHLDGGLVQVIGDSARLETSLKGTVIGMPEGIRTVEGEQTTQLPIWAWPIIIVCSLAPYGTVPLFFAGTSKILLLIFLPFAGLICSIILVAILSSIIEPQRALPFSDKLRPPRWYRTRISGVHYEPISDDFKEPQEAGTPGNTRRRKSKE